MQLQCTWNGKKKVEVHEFLQSYISAKKISKEDQIPRNNKLNAKYNYKSYEAKRNKTRKNLLGA